MRYWGHHMSDIVYESPDKDGFSNIGPYATDSYSLVLNIWFYTFNVFLFNFNFIFFYLYVFYSSHNITEILLMLVLYTNLTFIQYFTLPCQADAR